MPVHKPMRVLILDDEKVIADTLCMVLNQSGYEARPAYDHASAMATAREFEPDVLITGFNNGCEENGCETAAELLTFLPHCYVFIFSGSASTAPVLEEFWQLGYRFDVLAKPVHPQDLLNQMRKCEAADGNVSMAPRPMRVLILDDDKSTVDSLCMILKQNGYETRGVRRHDEAIATARAFEPDVLLSGFENGCDQNGCETAAEVLRFLPECRVIIFSGSAAGAPAIEEFWARGYKFDVFAKPLHPEDLINRLKEYERADRGAVPELFPCTPDVRREDRSWWDRLQDWAGRRS
ncbi:response regulator [Occallatibacter riparius]|uniref:Response regulator n=1 Tax=Occallatibacter riparius TaxID=1002689 RepID=A0A9J7BUR7_9BACT|nr:response regulator [Occallatibacter riparius]UWZ86620.1 response regulator [Occallatibacter riparius]